MQGQDEWREISELLHDARLKHIEWDELLGRVLLEFAPLRRNIDGTELAASTVTFRLDGVQAIGVGYESGIDGVRPSEYRPKRLLRLKDLRTWPFAPHEVFVSVNSASCLDDTLNAPLLRWLVGDQSGLQECAFRLGVAFSHTVILGLPTNTVVLLFGCEGFEVLSGEVPLDLETWAEQYAAWWAFWRKYWDEKRVKEAQGATGCREELFIPAAPPDPPDLSYKPPAEPPVEWERTDLPKELLQVITDWFGARFRMDWTTLARVYPNLNVSLQEHAEQLARWAEHDFGRWGYARQIDGWWVEGKHAEVTVRGIEHVMPDGEDAASNRETVWTVQLRRREEGWIIRTWSQGWPSYSSAPLSPPSDKPWLKRWRSGTVLSEREQFREG